MQIVHEQAVPGSSGGTSAALVRHHWPTAEAARVPAGVTVLVLLTLVTWIAGASALWVTASAALALSVAAVRSSRLRRWSALRRRRAQRRRATVLQTRKLASSPPERREAAAALAAIAEQLEGAPQRGALASVDVDGLVARYVDLTAAHTSYEEIARRAERTRMLGAKPALAPFAPDGLAGELHARRMRHVDECRRRAAELELELGAIAELILLVDQLAACQPIARDGGSDVKREALALEAACEAEAELLVPDAPR